MKRTINKSTLKTFLTFMSLLLSGVSFAQIRPETPQPSGLVDLTDTFDLIVIVVLPIVVFIGFIFWRRAMNIKKEELKEKERLIKMKKNDSQNEA